MSPLAPLHPVRLSVLCIEDNPDDADLCRLTLEAAGLLGDWRVAEDQASVLAALQPPVDLVLCDYHLPRYSPHQALELLRQQGQTVPLIVVSRAIGGAAAVSVLRAGAADYVAKNQLATLPAAVRRVLAAANPAGRERRLIPR